MTVQESIDAVQRKAPAYHVRWLVVSGPARRQGVGRALMVEAMRRFVSDPGVVEVVTFGPATPVPRLAGRGSFTSGLDSPRPKRLAPKAAPARSTARPSPDEAAPALATRGVTLHVHTRKRLDTTENSLRPAPQNT